MSSRVAPSTDTTAAIIVAQIRRWQRQPAVIHPPDSSRVAMLRQLLQLADSVGARVTVWLTPLQPSVLAALSVRREWATAFDVARRRMIAVTEENHASFVDVANEGLVEQSPDFWYDSYHCRDVLIARFARRLVSAGASIGKN